MRAGSGGVGASAEAEARGNQEPHLGKIRGRPRGISRSTVRCWNMRWTGVCAHVSSELVTSAQIAEPFVPPAADRVPAEFAEKKMADFVFLGAGSRRRREGGGWRRRRGR